MNALGALYEQLHDDAAKSALDKLALQQKADSRNMSFSGNIVVDGGTWGDAYDFSEKLRVLEDAAERCECLDICYVDRGGKESRRIVEAHLLVYKQNIWYLYAWCRTRRDFRLFRIGRIRSARLTGEPFAKREIDRANLPLKFDFGNTELIGVKLSVAQKAVPDVEEWLGVDNIRVEGNEIFAEATLPAGEVLLSKLLSLGDGVRVLSPAPLAEELKQKAAELLKLY